MSLKFDRKTKAFYDNLYKRLQSKSLDIKDLKSIFKTAKTHNEKLNVKDFFSYKNLLCVKSKIIHINSVALIALLYKSAFENDRNGFLCDFEIRNIIESFYNVKFDHPNYKIIKNHIINSNTLIYKPRIKSYEMNSYGFLSVDDLKAYEIMGEISADKVKNVRKWIN